MFLIAIGFSYFCWFLKKVFNGSWQTLSSFLFVVLFAAVLTCLIRNIKEKIVLARTYTGSLVNVIAVALGLAALQICGAGAPVCGAALGAGFMSALFPSFLLNFLACFGIYILIGSILTHLSAVVKGADKKSRTYN